MIEGVRTLGEVLRHRAERDPDLVIFRFLDDHGSELRSLTLGELDKAARSVGALLQSMGAAGRPVLLVFEPGRAFVEAFFGCVYAGALAVPVNRPRRSSSLQRVEAIARDNGATIALCDSASLPRSRLLAGAPALAGVRWTPTDAGLGTLWSLWKDQRLDRRDLCFLQYTSGSTGAPKGVMVSHGNLQHNLRSIVDAFGLSSSDRGLFWLPPFHDMGLIGAILTPIYVQMPSVIAPPAWFARKPERWLKAIAGERISVSGAPNFAYELCTEREHALDMTGLDLSCWEVAFVGAEPIRHDMLEQFARAFERHGFRRQSFSPCYGMAESTLMVTSVRRNAGAAAAHVDRRAYREDRVDTACEASPDTQPLVGCGQSWGEQSVLVVDPASRKAVPEGVVGEVWVSGESVCGGYYRNPELSRAVMEAELAGDTATSHPRGPYLRTGDKGFFRDGQLFIAGRIKDMVIVRGKNHYAEDIEHAIASSHDALRPGDGAAFSVPGDGGERLVAVYEVALERGDHERIWRNARLAVADTHEVTLHELVLIERRTLPRTTSGKVQRFEAKRRYLTASLRVSARFGYAADAELPRSAQAVTVPLASSEQP
jgi:acyl-CoA synthetase (AMP-forming)/AMP-acid ligase II